MMIQLITFVIFIFFWWLASRSLSVLKTLATIAGSTMFIMSLLYILMMIAAPAINPHGMLPLDLSFKKLIPTFNINYFTSLSMIERAKRLRGITQPLIMHSDRGSQFTSDAYKV
ncbi:hypothetical protein L1O48_06125, partial [Ligilactobacillus equi]